MGLPTDEGQGPTRTYARISREKFTHQVKFRRTLHWYLGDWRCLSEWCTETYGWGHWEYLNEHFMFTCESDKILFELRWL